MYTVFHLRRKPQRRREMSLEMKSDSMILLRLELPGKCSPASWAPCLPGDLGKVKPVSGDWSMKTSPKGRVWAQKSTLLCRAPGFPGSAQPANRKTFHGALRRYLRKRKAESFKEESSALRTGQAVVCVRLWELGLQHTPLYRPALQRRRRIGRKSISSRNCPGSTLQIAF